MWIDQDLELLARINRQRLARRDLDVEAFLSSVKASAMDFMAEDRKERIEAGHRFIASVSMSHQLNGYDRNVLNQWIEAGCPKKRPQLSFELQGEWRMAKEAVAREAQREAEINKRRKEVDEENRQRLAAEAKWTREWMQKYPVFARWIAERNTLKYERMKEELELERERIKAEMKEIERIEKIKHKGKWFSTILQMEEFEFVEWCEIADARDVDAYLETMRISGERARRNWLQKTFSYNHLEPTLDEVYKLLKNVSKENWSKVA